MANIRNLKKDINYLASELMMQAYFGRFYIKSLNDETFSEIVDEARNFKTANLAKVNHPDGKENPKLVKGFYKKVKKELENDFNKLIAKINVAENSVKA